MRIYSSRSKVWKTLTTKNSQAPILWILFEEHKEWALCFQHRGRQPVNEVYNSKECVYP